MRVAFCGGGTGGHVYPALTVAAALRRSIGESEPLEMLYIGVRGKIDAELVAREGIPFRAVTAGPLRAADALGTAKGGLKLLAGVAEAYSILGSFRPDVVFATGGYSSAGVGIAARLRRLPLFLFNPEVEGGLAVRVLSRIANQIAVTNPVAQRAIPSSKTVLTGYPVRAAFFVAQRDAARAALGLHTALPTLLVSGASTGANRLNKAAAALAPDFLRIGQLVHLSGKADEAWLAVERWKLPPDLQERYHLHAYLHDDMALALAASDIAVMRAGASTLGELPATRLPAILVPGEYEGWDQSPNARYLESEGAAVMLPQSHIDSLHDTVMELLADSDRRDRMRDALARLAHPDAADRLATLVTEMAGARQAVHA